MREQLTVLLISAKLASVLTTLWRMKFSFFNRPILPRDFSADRSQKMFLRFPLFSKEGPRESNKSFNYINEMRLFMVGSSSFQWLFLRSWSLRLSIRSSLIISRFFKGHCLDKERISGDYLEGLKKAWIKLKFFRIINQTVKFNVGWL